MDDPPDLWVLVFRALPGRVPSPVRVRRLLKWADQLGLVCERCRDADASETGELHAVIRALAERVHQQSELLAKRAEKGT